MNKLFKEKIIETAMNIKHGGLSKEELDYMYDLCENKIVLELGSMIGMSSFVIGSVSEILHSVDVWSDTQKHLIHSPEQAYVYKNYKNIIPNMWDAFNLNCKNLIDTKKIIPHRGLTLEKVSEFNDKSFDIIFIDADHSYKGVSGDFLAYENKLKDDGFFVFHDYGNSYWTDVEKFCNEMEEQKKIVRVGVCGLIAVFKRFVE